MKKIVLKGTPSDKQKLLFSSRTKYTAYGGDLVDQSGVPVYTDMTFEAEIPLVALLGLMCIRVAFLLPVLGR